ncbi:MAG: SDR family oxidoreductase, partial [bacterium]
DLVGLAGIRKKVSDTAGKAMLAVPDQTEDAGGYSSRKDISEIAVRGPLTPDHVLRTKNIPVMLDENPAEAIETFKNQYLDYFKRNTDGQLTCLDPAPRWAVWKEHGTLAFGRSVKETTIISDIIGHTRKTIQQVEDWSSWKALPEKDLFEVEYWELEQAKLGKPGKSPNFQGKIALVSGAASGIGRACAETLHQQGAAVLGLDLNPEVEKIFNKPGLMGFCCDVTDDESIRQAVNLVVRNFGGLDVLVSNAGNFPAGLTLEKMTAETWDSSMRLNLSSHQRLLTAATPFLQQSLDGAVVFIASRNVPAPGPGASAYSVAKAGLTQLARVASLELGSYGVRVNVLHPDCVYDTGLWSDDVLQGRAEKYGMSVEAYKSRNILKKEVTSREVAEMVAAVAGPVFLKTTGAQIPIDGGNDRVI